MKVLNNLTITNLKLNKKRTIVTIIGILLSTALMVGIGLLFSSARQFIIDDIIAYKGSQHISIDRVSDISVLKEDKNIEKYFYSNELGFSKIDSINEFKPYLCLLGVNKDYLANLTLLKGRFPESSNEVVVSSHIENNGGVIYNIGDTLKLDYGKRVSVEDNLSNSRAYEDGERLEITNHNEYIVVGIVDRSNYESYEAPGYSIFTLDERKGNNTLAFVEFKNPKKAYENTKELASRLGKEEKATNMYQDIEFNNTLLSIYGASKYDNYNSTIIYVMGIVLGVLSIGCIIVIYNSFAISVMERKKQFGLLSSIGATRKQMSTTVFFEALIVGTIGIVLGLLSAFLGIGIVIWIVNSLLSSTGFILKLSVYPMYIIVPCIFMIIVIGASAFIPSIRASRVSPIEAIRLSDDIKIKGKRVKSNRLITKLFGIEGDLAYKNIKRNKEKYRITILSIIVSVVLFISFNTFADYLTRSSEEIMQTTDFDIVYMNNRDDYEKDKLNVIFTQIRNHEQVKSSILVDRSISGYFKANGVNFTDNYKKNYMTYSVEGEEKLIEDINLTILKLSNQDYKKLLEKYNLKDNTNIFINYFTTTKYNNGNRKIYNGNILDNNKGNLNVCFTYYNDGEDKEYEERCKNIESDYYVLNDKYISTSGYEFPTLIVNEELYNQLNDMMGINNNIMYETLYLNVSKYDKLTKEADTLIKDYNGDIQVINFLEEYKMMNNIVLVVKILVYGFIVLVTAIGVTSVLNTINTSIALRRKEFAVLRSIGLTPQGFNKMIKFESLFFGLKSILFAIPISFGVICLFHLAMSDMVSFSNILIPWKGILLAAIFVFIIIFIAMSYSTRRIKHDNILDAIRDDNI